MVEARSIALDGPEAKLVENIENVDEIDEDAVDHMDSHMNSEAKLEEDVEEIESDMVEARSTVVQPAKLGEDIHQIDAYVRRKPSDDVVVLEEASLNDDIVGRQPSDDVVVQEEASLNDDIVIINDESSGQISHWCPILVDWRTIGL
jgi:hypothetical protein